METLDVLLARHEFFRGLKPEYLAFIAGCARNAHAVAGEYLFREGDEADRFFAVRKGTVALETFVPQRGAVTIQTVREGDIVGWSWLFPPYRWQFDARAREDVSLTVFDGACLRQKCDADPALGYELMKRMAHVVSERFESARIQLLDVYGTAARR